MKNVFLAKRLHSFKYALNGILHLWKKEIYLRIHIFASITATALGWLIEITRTKWLLIIICVGIVLGAEALNSAIERICDFVSPDKNHKGYFCSCSFDRFCHGCSLDYLSSVKSHKI